MTNDFLEEIRKIPAFGAAILSSVTLTKAEKNVEVRLVTDKTYSPEDESRVKSVVRTFVPDYFSCETYVAKVAPDEEMIRRRILSLIEELNRQIAAFVTEDDIKVEKTEKGFDFTVTVVRGGATSETLINTIAERLKRNFCGEFSGKFVVDTKKVDEVQIEEPHENVQYETPIRYFPIEDFTFIEGTNVQKRAVYLSDLNFETQSVAVCGKIEDIREREYTRSNGQQKVYYSYLINDGTAAEHITYFPRMKTIEKIKKLKVGDSVVLTCRVENYKGQLRPTAINVDMGHAPADFKPEKRPSKPVPRYYETIFPQPFTDFTQDDMFSPKELPACLRENTFVVFDLETTGLSSSPVTGNMDRIIEIGAYKVIGGEIKESFRTFVNPQKRLSDEIVNLTGIHQEQVDSAPVYEKVMPDFFKFCSGSYLVGHNIAGFDIRFVDYYWGQCGYSMERKIFDTIPLSQQLLRLPNYKLNTVADYFGIKFNHHRAEDDALVTAKIFIELIKIKKSLPNLC